jgi:hypothetical protein
MLFLPDVSVNYALIDRKIPGLRGFFAFLREKSRPAE